MTTQLDSLRSMTVVVADTGDIDAIKKYSVTGKVRAGILQSSG